jgi:hypothetical protein
MRKEDLRKPISENLADLADMAERDHEVQMARAELYKLAKYSIKLHDMLKQVSEREGLEGWVQSKITKAADYVSSVYHHLDYETKFEGQMESAVSEAEYKASLMARLNEKAVSKAQQRAAGIALAAKKKGEKPAGSGAAAQMADMSKKDLEDFAGTKHKGLPDKKTDESGLQRYTGIKKYGKKGFEELQKAGREGASEEEKGAIKDKYLKNKD